MDCRTRLGTSLSKSFEVISKVDPLFDPTSPCREKNPFSKLHIPNDELADHFNEKQSSGNENESGSQNSEKKEFWSRELRTQSLRNKALKLTQSTIESDKTCFDLLKQV